KWRSSFMQQHAENPMWGRRSCGLSVMVLGARKLMKSPWLTPGACILPLVLASGPLFAQPAPIDLTQALNRLDRLEKQNQELTDQIRLLREQLSAAQSAITPAGSGPSENEQTE